MSARFLAGIPNTVADDISRLHEPGRLSRMLPYVKLVPFPPHVSSQFFFFLFPDPRTRALLTDTLDRDASLLRSQTFAESTARTYRSQQFVYLQFCDGLGIMPVYGKPFYYLFYKSDIWFNISDILYNI